MIRLAAAFLMLMVGNGSALAQMNPSPELRDRAQSLVSLFNRQAQPAQIFSPTFLKQVPAAQMEGIVRQLGEQLGSAKAIGDVQARSRTQGLVTLQFEKGLLRLNLAVAAAKPHLIEGVLITGTELAGDSLDKVMAELKALPGETGFAVAKLGDGNPALLASHQVERPLAIGSTFKLFLLAELSRSVSAGKHKWTDVARLERRSLPSGFLQNWPKGAPLTYYSLAALMISQSDNSATDSLLVALGREKVEALLPILGVRAADRNRPLLATMEAFALKAGPDAKASREWASATEVRKRGILPGLAATPHDQIDGARLTGGPNAIDTVEWFAAPEDLVRTMDWLRRNGGREALDILAINPGIGAGMAAQQAYIGYKGGSEIGVINMTFLVRTRSDVWHVVSGSWNDPKAPLDEQKFVSLMTRAVSLLR